jgi:uncharacterized caspase-like protein/DNA polymerase III delta prime subunit
MPRYALIIGINKYGKAGFNDLRHSVTDAERIAQILERGGNFQVKRLPPKWNEEHNRYEVDDKPLDGNTLGKAISDFFQDVGSNEALIYFSGHGFAVTTNTNIRNGYLITSDCTTETVSSKGVSLAEVNALILSAKCSSLTVLLDCCHAGIFLEESLISRSLTAFNSGGRNYFLAAACRSHQNAYEEKDHSVFTGAVLKALKSPGPVGVSKLHQIIDEELPKAGQEPVIISSGGSITLVTNGVIEKVEADEPDKLQAVLEKLRSDYEILDEAFFKGVAAKVAKNQARTQILSLRAANWSMLFQESYVERDQQGEALETALNLSNHDGISLLLICGEPGAGKTALLRWLARELFYQGKRVFHKKKQSQFGWLEQLRKFSEESGGEHFYVITDDIFRDEMILDQLEQNEFPFSLTLIGTTRQNENLHTELQGLDYEITCLNLKKPSEAEKKRILALPEIQTHLAGKSESEKQELMDSPIMLVLMLQLSEGKPFDLLLWEIVKDLSDTDRKPLYQIFGVLCSFFQYGIVIPFEILQLCLPSSDWSEKLVWSNLKGLIDIAIYGRYEGFNTVHELIAKTVMNINYEPKKEENQPYAWIDHPPLLERHLRSIVSNINTTQKLQKWWVSNSLIKLGKNQELKLITRILEDYSDQIQTIQEQNTISEWADWIEVYMILGFTEKQQECIQSILLAQPDNLREWLYWFSLIQRLGDLEQKRIATIKIQNWLDWLVNHLDDADIYASYLGLIVKVGNVSQQQEAITQTKIWLEQYPDNQHVRSRYLGLIVKVGSVSQQQEAIIQTKIWLEQYPDNQHILTKYLKLIEQLGNRFQQQEAIIQAKIWLEQHSDDKDVRVRYLGLVEKLGSQDQQQAVITQTEIWLKQHPAAKNVRVRYLGLVEKLGSQDQQQAAITQTEIWLEQHSDDKYVRVRYLGLVEKLGSQDQQQAAIVQTEIWLEQHSDDWEVRRQYLILISKSRDERNLTRSIIQHHWKWIIQQKYIDQGFWLSLIPVLYNHTSPDIYQLAIELALKQHPDDMFIACSIFGYFRDYLDIFTCQNIAIRISKSRLPINKWQNLIHAANFFRDHADLKEAEDIYCRIINLLSKKMKNSPNLHKSFNFAKISYAQLHLLTDPPQPDKACKELDNILKENPKHSYAHLLMARSYQIKGKVFNLKAKKHFEKAVLFDTEKNGFFQYQFGCFHRYSVENNPNARKHFEVSIAQNSNLPAYLELAELEAEDGNIDRAKTLLQNGLDIPIITRPQREEREKFSDRITTLKLLLDIPAS